MQRTSPHIGQGGDLDNAFLDVGAKLLPRQHVVERVVQRSKIGIHLLFQIARQEAKTLACFHRRTGKDDLGDLIVLERGNCNCHRHIRLACPRGSHGKHDIVLPNLPQVRPLAGSFRTNDLVLCVQDQGVKLVLGQGRCDAARDSRFAVGRHQIDDGFHVVGRQVAVPRQEEHHLPEDAFELIHFTRVPPEGDEVAPYDDGGIETPFHNMKVLVVQAEECDCIHPLHSDFLFVHTCSPSC